MGKLLLDSQRGPFSLFFLQIFKNLTSTEAIFFILPSGSIHFTSLCALNHCLKTLKLSYQTKLSDDFKISRGMRGPLGKLCGEKICFCLDFSPLYFWLTLRNFLKTLFYVWIKASQSVWILSFLPHFPWQMSKQKQKKFLIIFGIK